MKKITWDNWTEFDFASDLAPLYVEDASRFERLWKDNRRQQLSREFGPANNPDVREQYDVGGDWARVEQAILSHLQQLKVQQIVSGILADTALIQTTGKCKYPDRLLATVQAMLTRHLPADDTDPLHSGRIDSPGEVLGDKHQRYTISAEWRGLGRLPVGYIEFYSAGDDWYRFELARYESPPEVEDDSPAEDFFDGLIAQLERDYSAKAMQTVASGAAESPQSAERSSVPQTII